MVIDDNEILAEIFEKVINADIHCINTKDKDIVKILDEINRETKNNNTEAIFINAHLTFNEHSYRHQCGGIELLKHIRLTKELEFACRLPIILGTLLPVEYYILKGLDNLIILSPGSECLFLPELSQKTFDLAINRIRTRIGAERFSSFEKMQKKLEEYVIFTSTDRNYFNPEEPTTHDIRNKIGSGMFIKQFCPKTSEKHHFLREYLQKYENLRYTNLPFKKAEFLGIVKLEEKEPWEKLDSELQHLAKEKKFLFIEDQPYGWLEALYCGLFGKTAESFDCNGEVFEMQENSCTTRGNAEEFVEKKAKEFDEALVDWVNADKKFDEINQRFKKIRSDKEKLEREFKEAQRQEHDWQKKIDSYENKLKDLSKEYKEERQKIWAYIMDVHTSPGIVKDEDIERIYLEELPEKLLTFKKLEENYRWTQQKTEEIRKSYEEAKQHLQKAKKNFDQIFETLKQTEREHEKAKSLYGQASSKIKQLFPYDLIFLDLRLKLEDKGKPIEESSGIKILSKIKEINPAIPVIVFTASEKALSHQKALELGADEYWIKAVSSGDELKRIIINCLKKEHFIINSKKIYLPDLWVKIRQVEKKEKIYYQYHSPNGYSVHTLDQGHSYRAEINKCLRDSFQFLWQRPSNYVSKIAFGNANRFDHIAVNMRCIQEIRHKRDEELRWKDIKNRVTQSERELYGKSSDGAHAFTTYSPNIAHVREEDAIYLFDFTLDCLLKNL